MRGKLGLARWNVCICFSLRLWGLDTQTRLSVYNCGAYLLRISFAIHPMMCNSVAESICSTCVPSALTRIIVRASLVAAVITSHWPSGDHVRGVKLANGGNGIVLVV